MRPPEFDGYPDGARIWVFGSERGLNPAETESLLAAVDRFLSSWRAHGVPLRATRAWLHDHFLIVCVDTETELPSGCSIDALTQVLREVEAGLGVRFLGNEPVWYRDRAGCIRRATRPEFRALARAGKVTGESVVFDNSLTRLQQLRAGRWEGPARERWHSVFFEPAARSGARAANERGRRVAPPASHP